MNKAIHRNTATSTGIFDDRTLHTDYPTLVPLLRKGLRVLDVGCGTGAISRGIADAVGPQGAVIGIDNTKGFIESGKAYLNTRNLELVHVDLFDFRPEQKFDLVIAARVLQWLSDPRMALERMASFVKPGGQISMLDYNHEALVWEPDPPESMRSFYHAFLKWRSDAGMDNAIAIHLKDMFDSLGLQAVEVINADEVYKRGDANFTRRVGIWAKVAELKQIVDEGYLDEPTRVRAIDEYNEWIERDAQRMVMKLNEVRGKVES